MKILKRSLELAIILLMTWLWFVREGPDSSIPTDIDTFKRNLLIMIKINKSLTIGVFLFLVSFMRFSIFTVGLREKREAEASR